MALSSKGGGGSNRGRPYGMMLLLAFGAAVLGVMVLHKLRERRIFTLLIKDKDHDLFALHLLLQKERESAKELKRKVEELKAKTYSLRTQKMELINKVGAMQAISSAITEEKRALETRVAEKQNEINKLQQMKIDSNKEDSQVAALRELLKQKEAEIGQMKHLIEKPTNIWSVSTDDPSNPAFNLTSAAVSDKSGIWKHKEPEASFKDEQSEKFTVHDNGKASSVRVEGDTKGVAEGTELKETHEGQKHEFENDRDGEASRERSNAVEKNTEQKHSRENVLEDKMSTVENPKGNEGFKERGSNEGFIERGENGNINKTEVTTNFKDGGLNSENETSDALTTDAKEHGVETNNSESGKVQVLGKLSKMEMKLKRQYKSGSKVKDSSERGISRTNRRRIISKDMASSENGAAKRMGDNTIADIPEEKRWKVMRRDERLHQNDNVQDHGNVAVQKPREVSVGGNPTDHSNVHDLRSSDRIDFREKRGVASSEENFEHYKTYGGEKRQTEDSKQGVTSGDSSFIQTAKDTRTTSANSAQQVGKSDDFLSKEGQSENKQTSQYREGMTANSIIDNYSKLSGDLSTEDQKVAQVTNGDSSTNSMEQKEVEVARQEEEINVGKKSESSEVKHVMQQPEETEVQDAVWFEDNSISKSEEDHKDY